MLASAMEDAVLAATDDRERARGMERDNSWLGAGLNRQHTRVVLMRLCAPRLTELAKRGQDDSC
jgi:hypothetical protein